MKIKQICLGPMKVFTYDHSLEEKIAIPEGFLDLFWEPVCSGEIKPVIDSVFPIRETEKAHQRMRENKNTGKIILSLENSV